MLHTTVIDDDQQPRRVRLAGLTLMNTSVDGAVALCRARISGRLGGYVCFVNAHSLTEATSDAGLREALGQATYCFADGMPLVWLARAIGTPLDGRVCGPDLTDRLLRAEAKITHGFIGGAPATGDIIARRYGVRGVAYSPPIRAFSEEAAREDWARFLDRWPESEPPRVVWIGLGAPKQERWLQTVSSLASSTLFLGVGAAFDFLSLVKPRAPVLMQRLGLEWIHRFAHEPRRLWKRYLITNSRFMSVATRELTKRRCESRTRL